MASHKEINYLRLTGPYCSYFISFFCQPQIIKFVPETSNRDFQAQDIENEKDSDKKCNITYCERCLPIAAISRSLKITYFITPDSTTQCLMLKLVIILQPISKLPS